MDAGISEPTKAADGAASLPYPTVAKKLRVITCANNEQRDLPRCMECIPPGVKVTVVDSGSTDPTPDIARSYGADVVFHAFEGFSQQHNWAVTEAGVTEEWAVIIDADEVYTKKFWDWAEDFLKKDQPYDVIYISQRVALDGKILKHAPSYPLWHPRMVRTGRPQWVVGDAGPLSESPRPDARLYKLDIPYIHYWHGGPMKPWLEKHLRLAVADVVAKPTSGDQTLRMRVNRLMGPSLFKVLFRFFWHYVLSGGFLDGRAGWRFSVMYTWHEMSKWVLKQGPAEHPPITYPPNVVKRSRIQ